MLLNRFKTFYQIKDSACWGERRRRGLCKAALVSLLPQSALVALTASHFRQSPPSRGGDVRPQPTFTFPTWKGLGWAGLVLQASLLKAGAAHSRLESDTKHRASGRRRFGSSNPVLPFRFSLE